MCSSRVKLYISDNNCKCSTIISHILGDNCHNQGRKYWGSGVCDTPNSKIARFAGQLNLFAGL